MEYDAGYNDKEMGPKIALLRQRGIMPILNYASEDHVFGSVDKDVDFSEARRDVNAARFIDGINSCSTPGPHRSFASVKVAINVIYPLFVLSAAVDCSLLSK